MPVFDIAASFNRFAVACVPALLGIILHEVAHGWTAERCGDPTARLAGRLTLNPVPHIDPAGLLVFAITSITGPFVFGWARPVPVNPRWFGNPRRDMMLVALSGPLTNMLLALTFAVLLRVVLGVFPPGEWIDVNSYRFVLRMLQTGVLINFGLAWLNLIPIPPLDGSRVAAWFMPDKLAYRYYGLERYGFIILILLLATGALSVVLGPLVMGSTNFVLDLVGIG